jgi:hypothetical protein
VVQHCYELDRLIDADGRAADSKNSSEVSQAPIIINKQVSTRGSDLFERTYARVIALLSHLVIPGGIEVSNVKVGVFILLHFASLPYCSQNQTAVSDTLRLLSDF